MGHSAPSETNKLEKIRSMINKIGSAFMVTQSQRGSRHGRPMATAEVAENATSIWFATQRDSGKVEELEADDRVFLGYGNSTGTEIAITVLDTRAIGARSLGLYGRFSC